MELSRDVRAIMSIAYNTAREQDNEYLTPEHVLYSILDNNEEIINKLELNTEELMEDLKVFFETKIPQTTDKDPIESLGFNNVIQRSVQQVENSSRNIVEVGDVIVAIHDEKGFGQFIMLKNGIERITLLQAVTELHGTDNQPDLMPAGGQIKGKRKKKSLLDEFTLEMVAHAKAGKYDPIVGRVDEIERTVQVLCRKKKNNPIHVGEPGCGKCLHGEEKINLLVSDEMYKELKEFI